MCVDETGGDQGVLIFDDFGIGGQVGQQHLGRAYGRDLAVFDHQEAVGEVFVGGLDAHFGGVG
ncbi:hypothetical protein D3C71_2252560 [compost metagenome]